MVPRSWTYMGPVHGGQICEQDVGTTVEMSLIDRQRMAATRLGVTLTRVGHHPDTGQLEFEGTMRYGPDTIRVAHYSNGHGPVLQEV